MVASFFHLDAVINALREHADRGAVHRADRAPSRGFAARRAGRDPGFRMTLYPLPSLIALAGWVFVLACSGMYYNLAGLGSLAVGACVYFVWSRRTPDDRENNIVNE